MSKKFYHDWKKILVYKVTDGIIKNKCSVVKSIKWFRLNQDGPFFDVKGFSHTHSVGATRQAQTKLNLSMDSLQEMTTTGIGGSPLLIKKQAIIPYNIKIMVKEIILSRESPARAKPPWLKNCSGVVITSSTVTGS